MNKHFRTITEYLYAIGKDAPQHPLFAVLNTRSDTAVNCIDRPDAASADFYMISMKQIIEGEVIYGRQKYDCQNGTLLFMAPDQHFQAKNVRIKAEGRVILIHPDFLKGHPLAEQIKEYRFFDYAVNEALHLSPREEVTLRSLFSALAEEYEHGYDEHSRDIYLSLLTTILNYSQRYYQRQFIQRKEMAASLLSALTHQLQAYYETELPVQELPSVNELALQLGFSARYLSDALKAETGLSTKEHVQRFLIDKAKDSLAGSNRSVTEISEQLGYDSVQYFARIFKKKTGMTPSEFRQSLH